MHSHPRRSGGTGPTAASKSGWGVGRPSASVGSLGSVQTSVPDVWYFVEKMGWSQSSSRWAHGATAARDHQPDGWDGTVGLRLVREQEARRPAQGSPALAASKGEKRLHCRGAADGGSTPLGKRQRKGRTLQRTGRRLSTMS